MRIILFFVVIFALGCNTASVPRNPKPVNAQQFKLMLTGYRVAFNTIETKFPSTYSASSREAMRNVLLGIDRLNTRLGNEPGGNSASTRTFWFNEYSLVLVDINNDYRRAIELIVPEFGSLPKDTHDEFIFYHNRTLGFYELFKQLRLAPTQMDITADMGRLLSMVNSMAYVAKQVTT